MAHSMAAAAPVWLSLSSNRTVMSTPAAGAETKRKVRTSVKP
jgi:hypothetical protein